MQTTLSLRQFSVTYPAFTLAPLTLDFRVGDRVAFVGPNGSGKTTTLRALAGRLPDYDGTVLLGGRDLRELLPTGRSQIGMLPETLAGYGWMSVRDHLAFLRNFYPAWDRGYEAHLADRLRLPLDQLMGRLSKGTRVKVSFIAAEACRPPVLLLDEPTSGLDPDIRQELIDAILTVRDEGHQRILVFSTHLLEDVELVADRVILLVDGRLGMDETVATLRARHPDASLIQTLREEMRRARS